MLVSKAALTIRPARVVVLAIRLTIASRLTSGRPRQFCVMKLNCRCSILFHLLVPGGEVADDQPDRQFVGQLLQAHLPEPATRAVAAAVGRDQQFAARGNRRQPILAHQRRMLLAANCVVSWSMPTLTHPWSLRMS